jgi:hypothetical protein
MALKTRFGHSGAGRRPEPGIYNPCAFRNKPTGVKDSGQPLRGFRNDALSFFQQPASPAQVNFAANRAPIDLRHLVHVAAATIGTVARTGAADQK